MGITLNGFDVIAANMTGSALVTHCAIGSGGSVFDASDTTLNNEVERNAYTSADLSTASQVTFITDWSPVEMSGLIIQEHAMMTAGSVMTNREVLNGSLVFDGESEFQIQYTFKFFQ